MTIGITDSTKEYGPEFMPPLIQDDAGIQRDSDTPVFCKDCAHVIGVRHNLQDWQRWKCGGAKNKIGVNLVNGEAIFKFPSCEECRKAEEGGCGQFGMWYLKYVKPDFYQHPHDQQQDVAAPVPGATIGGKSPADIDKANAARERIRQRLAEKKPKLSDGDLANL